MWNPGQCLFHFLPNPEFSEYLVGWIAPRVLVVSLGRTLSAPIPSHFRVPCVSPRGRPRVICAGVVSYFSLSMPTLDGLFTFPRLVIFSWTIPLLILLIAYSYELHDSIGIFVYQVPCLDKNVLLQYCPQAKQLQFPCITGVFSWRSRRFGGYKNPTHPRLFQALFPGLSPCSKVDTSQSNWFVYNQ